MFKFGKTSLRTLKTVDGRVQALTYAVLDNSPYDFGIPKTGGRRTASSQNALFKKNWSQLDGYNKRSYHQSGFAIDIFLLKDGKADYSCVDKYKEVAELFKTYFELLKDIGVFPNDSYIRWGGDWKNFVDIPHFEIRNLS